MESVHRPLTFDRVARIVFIAICVVGAIWVIDYLSGVLLPFLVACVLAYLLNPMVEHNCRLLHMKRRLVPTIVTLFEIVAIMIVAFYVFAPFVVAEVKEMVDMLNRYSQMNTDGKFLSEEVHAFIRQHINVEDLSKLLTRDQWINIISTTANNTWSFVGSTLSILFTIASWIIVLLYLVFLLLDYDKIKNGLHRAIPARYQNITWSIISDTANVMQRYFRGQSLIAFIVGILFSAGFVIVGLPLGLIFGLFVGMLNLVPYLQLISIPVALVLCLVDSITTGGNFWVMLGEVAAVYCIVQVIQDLIITPKVMGREMGLNPVFVFLSLSVWAALLGFIGLIVALPLTTLVISYYKRYVLGRVGETSGIVTEENNDDSLKA